MTDLDCRPIETPLPLAPAHGRGADRPSLALVAVMGLAATLLVVVGGALSGAASPGGGIRLWSVPTIPVDPTIDLLPALGVFYGGMILLVRAWLKLRRHVLTHGATVWAVVAIVIVWAVPLLAGPPLGSRDVYAYAAQGRMADVGLDVYEEGPVALGDDPVLEPVDPLYLEAPVVYGPVFVALSSAVSSQSSDVVESVLWFRAMAVIGVALTALAVWDIARGLGRDPVDALVLAIANPLTLLHLVSGAHNEAIMLAFLVGGVAVGRRPHLRFVGIVLCAFAAAIKMPAILGVAFLAWPWVVERASLRVRAVRLLLSGGLALTVIALAGQLTGWGWGWVDAIVAARPVNAYLSVTRVAGGAVHLMTGLDAAPVLAVARLTGLLLAGAITVGLLLRGRMSVPSALAWSLLFLALLHPTTQPWYLTWGFMLLAATSAGARNRTFVAASAMAAFVVLPVGPQLALVLLEDTGTASLAVAVGFLALLTISPRPVRPSEPGSGRAADVVTVVVPTRNEQDNVGPLVDRVAAAVGDRRLEILFVDDSTDATPAAIEAAGDSLVSPRHRVSLLHRTTTERWGGLGGAAVDGFRRARGGVAVVIDGDLQHPPEVIPELIHQLERGNDLVIASRHVAGGSDAGLSAGRSRLSRWAAVAARRLFPHRVGPVSDPLSGFFAVRLDRIDLGALHPDGFKILVELLVTHPDLRVAEVPFRFEGRVDGHSKASLAQGLVFLGHLVDLRLRTSRPWAGAVAPPRVFRSA